MPKSPPATHDLPLHSPLVVASAYQLLLIFVVRAGAWLVSPAGETGDTLAAILRGWDARHYLLIAQEGYGPGTSLPQLIVFFPLYPLVIALLGPVLGPLQAALTVTTATSIAAHALLFEYLKMIGYHGSARRRVMGLIFVMPASIYFTAVYTEALYLLLTVVFLILLRRGDYFWAAVCGGAAALTRNMGALFVIPYLAACVRSGPLSVALRRASYGLIIASGTGLYLLMNAFYFDDPLAFTRFQADVWFKTSVNPLAQYWDSLVHFGPKAHSIGPGYELIYVDRVATLAFPLLLAAWWLRVGIRGTQGPEGSRALPPGFFLWTLAQYAVICSQSFWVSNTRYLCLILPAYLMLGRLLDDRWRYGIYFASSAATAMWAAHGYVHGRWVF